MGPWQQREINMALERQAREREFRVIPVLLPAQILYWGFCLQTLRLTFAPSLTIRDQDRQN